MEDKNSFLWNVHSYMNEYIRFADTKAGVVTAWSTALLSVLVATRAFNHFLDGKLWCVTGWIALLSFALLAGAFGTAVFVIAPDLRVGGKEKRTRDLIFWKSVREFKNADEYRQAVESETDPIRPLASHVYSLADVAKRKFRCVDLSILLAAVGTLFAIVVIFALNDTPASGTP